MIPIPKILSILSKNRSKQVVNKALTYYATASQRPGNRIVSFAFMHGRFERFDFGTLRHA